MTQSWIVTFNDDVFNIWDINNLSLHATIGEDFQSFGYLYYKTRGRRYGGRGVDYDDYFGDPFNEYSILVHEFDEYLGNDQLTKYGASHNFSHLHSSS